MTTTYEIVVQYPATDGPAHIGTEYASAAEVLAVVEAMLEHGWTADRIRVSKVDREDVGLPQLRAEVESAERNPKTCEYFALCTNDADGTVTHPVLGQVPTCIRCAEKMEKDLHPFEAVGS